MLDARDLPGDAERSASLRADALAIARELGMQRLIDRLSPGT